MKKIIILFTFIMAVVMCFTGCSNLGGGNSYKKTEGVDIVASLDDKINGDTAWCATFQLVWNDMQDLLTDNGVYMDPQPETVDNLNKQTFKENMLSAEYYYKKFDEASPELKEEILKGIKEKFNQDSDILDQVDFSKSTYPEIKKYIFYAMLYREFTYEKKFNDLDKGNFKGSNPSSVEYFGVSKDSNNKEKLLSQLEALYYNSYSDLAIKIYTKEGDEVILVKKPEGSTFNEIWNIAVAKSEKYDSNAKKLRSDDSFKMPKLAFNVTKEFKEIEEKPFNTKNGNTASIDIALQNIQFEIDAMGGRIKSEAVIGVKESVALLDESRDFDLNDTFAIFLKEKDKEVPYFAALVDDITKY